VVGVTLAGLADLERRIDLVADDRGECSDIDVVRPVDVENLAVGAVVLRRTGTAPLERVLPPSVAPTL
jgi:hypothetical protein